MKIMVILLVISIICLIVSLYLLAKSYIEIRRNKKDIPDWDNMSIQEIVDTLNKPQKDTLYFLVGRAVEEARQEPIHVETHRIEPTVLKTKVCVDYTMLNHMDEDDIQNLVTERLARDFGNAIAENPDLYFIRDELDPMSMNKIYEARMRIVPWK
jgi:hypothetical protein